MTTTPACQVEGCDRHRTYRLYCNAHYRRWKRTGDPGPTEIKSLGEGPRVCRFDGCDRPKRTNGLCAAHYLQQFHGKPLAPLKARPDTVARDEHGRKQCTACEEWHPVERFYGNPKTLDKLYPHCIRCHRSGALRRMYGITMDEYEDLLRQQSGVCAICGGVNDNGRKLYVDHDHATGAVRGLLCNPCNRGVGYFRDSAQHLQAAISYLGVHTATAGTS